MANLDSIFKSRDITLPTKVHLVKAMVFPVVMYGCESWTAKKAEHRRIDAFEVWCWRRLLRVPWTARRSNQSILKEISPGVSLEGMMLGLEIFFFPTGNGQFFSDNKLLTVWFTVIFLNIFFHKTIYNLFFPQNFYCLNNFDASEARVFNHDSSQTTNFSKIHL